MSDKFIEVTLADNRLATIDPSCVVALSTTTQEEYDRVCHGTTRKTLPGLLVVAYMVDGSRFTIAAQNMTWREVVRIFEDKA